MPRPKLSETKINKSVTLTRETMEALTILGKGNLSAGIEAVAQWSRDELKALVDEQKKIPPLDLERYGKTAAWNQPDLDDLLK